jgi:hypothetical protein
MLHRLKQDDPIPMSERRLSLFELLQNHTNRIRNWLAVAVFPIPNRNTVGCVWRFNEIRYVRRQSSLLDFPDMSGIQTIGDSHIPTG